MSEHHENEIQEHTIRQRGMIVERDFRGRIISAHVPNPFLIDQLLEQQVIDHEQHWHGARFIAMHSAFLGRIGRYNTVKMYSADTEERRSIEYPIEDSDYLFILRAIPHEWQKKLLRIAITEEFSLRLLESLIFDKDLDKQEQKRRYIDRSFTALVNAMQKLLEMKKARAEEERKKVLAQTGEPCNDACDLSYSRA